MESTMESTVFLLQGPNLDTNLCQRITESLGGRPFSTIGYATEALQGGHGSFHGEQQLLRGIDRLSFCYISTSDEIGQHVPLLRNVMCLGTTIALNKVLQLGPRRVEIKRPYILYLKGQVGEVGFSTVNGITKVTAVICLNRLENGDRLRQVESMTTLINEFQQVHSLLRNEGLESFGRHYLENSMHRNGRFPLCYENGNPVAPPTAVKIVGLAKSGYLQASDANRRGNAVAEYEIELCNDNRARIIKGPSTSSP